jgi:hypothetical protein
MLTNTQQKTIEFLTAQFEKLNASTQPKTKFNLVDIKPLEDKAERIKQLDEEEEISKKMWTDAQESELQRIADLLREDLPEDRILIKINPYSREIKICRIQFTSNGTFYVSEHKNDCVTIGVKIRRESFYDEYSTKHRDKCFSIYYTILQNISLLETKNVEYNTIEELVSTDEFKDTLRKRVL